MRFGAVATEQSLGGILVHGVHFKGVTLKKGQIIHAEHIGALRSIGLESITVAQLEDGDVEENTAALLVAEVITGANLCVGEPGTGRVNLYAAQAGLFIADEARINQLNEIDEGITLATRKPKCSVAKGEMVATVKIIPFAVPKPLLAQAVRAARQASCSVREFLPLRIGVISTLLPGLKPGVISKTLDILAARIAMTPARIIVERQVTHAVDDLTPIIREVAALSDLVIIFGASAITDRRDVIPAALEECGGQILHFGMPVDPGNLLLIGQLEDGKPVIGAPGCARSPKESGFDWVLHRLLAALPISSAEIRRMGAGGLLIGAQTA